MLVFGTGGGVPLLVLLGAWLFSVSVYAYLGTHNLDSDQSSEMVLAQLLNETGSYLTEDWYYSTELRVVSPVPVYQLALLLFDSWHAARVFSIAILLMSMALSLIYMLRSIGIKEAAIYAASCLMLPVSWVNAFTLVYGQFYSVYFVTICLLLGLLFRLRDGRKNGLKLLVILVLSVWSGMQGVRMLMLCAAPLLISLFLLFLVSIQECKTICEARCILQNLCASGVLLICLGTSIGYLINHLVLSGVYSYRSFSDTLFYNMNWDAFAGQINRIPEYLGFVNGVNLLSLDGIRNALAIILFLSGVISVFNLSKRKAVTERVVFLSAFAGVSVMLGLMLNSMTSFGLNNGQNPVAYYLPGLMLMLVMIFVYIEKRFIGSKVIKTSIYLMVLLMFAANSVLYIRGGMKSNAANYEVRASDLLRHGLTTGFATFWNGNVLTEASDGQIDVYVYNTWEDRHMYPWLQKKEHFEKPHEGKVFVLIDIDEMAQNPPLAKAEKLLCETYNGKIYLYDSAQEVMDIQYEEITKRRESGLLQ